MSGSTGWEAGGSDPGLLFGALGIHFNPGVDVDLAHLLAAVTAGLGVEIAWVLVSVAGGLAAGIVLLLLLLGVEVSPAEEELLDAEFARGGFAARFAGILNISVMLQVDLLGVVLAVDDSKRAFFVAAATSPASWS